MKISIVITTRSREKMLDELILSMSKINDKEIIIIDNNDEKENYTNKYIEDNIFIYRQKNNRSLYSGRNLGILKATGDYILFVDDDDLMHEQFIKFINKYNKKYNVLRFCETHFPIKSKRRPSFSFKWLSFLDRYYLYQQSSFLYKRDFLIKNNLKFKNAFGEDRVFYADLLHVVGKQRMVHKYSIWYRNDKPGLTRTNKEKSKENYDSFVSFLKANGYHSDLKRYLKDNKNKYGD